MTPLQSFALAAALVLVSAVGVVEGIVGIPDFSVRVTRGPVDKSRENEEIETFVISNKKGLKVELCTWGATVTHLSVPDKAGKSDDIVLGYDKPSDYQSGTMYFGAIVGRVANRIAEGRFNVDGKEYTLAKNDGGVHSLHGGTKGFDKKNWDAKILRDGVEFTLRSPDGDEGYPGTVVAKARYILKDWTLNVEMTATSSAATPINLAQHSYFNLAGHSSGSVLGHELELAADAYTELKNSVCTGRVLSCAGTPLDFSRAAVVGERMEELAASQELQLAYDKASQALLAGPNRTKMTAADKGGPLSGTVLGFDHNYVVRPPSWLARLPLVGRAWEVRKVGTVREGRSGRRMEVASDAPGVQLYSGNFLDGGAGKGGAVYGQHAALCLETQHFPNSIGADPDSAFGRGACPVLRPGASYRHRVRYTFGVDAEAQ